MLSAFLAALTAIFVKAGVKNIDSDLATAVRTVVILFLVWAIVFFKGTYSGIASFTKSNWGFLVLSGLATGLSWIFYFKALQTGKVSEVAPIDKLSIALTIILAVVLLDEPLTLKMSIGALLIIAGTIIIII